VFKITLFIAIIELCTTEKIFHYILNIIAFLGTIFSIQSIILLIGVSLLNFKPDSSMIRQHELGSLMDIDYGLQFYPFWGFTKTLVPGTNLPRNQGMFIEPGYFANFLQLSIFATLAAIASPRKKSPTKKRSILNMQIIIQVIALFFTFSTIGWIATGGSVLFYLFILIKKQPIKTMRKTLLFIGITSLIVSMSFCFFADTTTTFYKTVWTSKFTSNQEGENSSETRLRVAGEGIRYFLERPIFGWGIAETRLMSGMTLNNAFITTAAELGILGLLAYLSILYAIILTIFKTLFLLKQKALVLYHSRSVWVISCFIGMFLHSMTRDIQWSFFYWIGIGLLYSNYHLLKRKLTND